jgi:hypothetical protein
MDRAIEEHEQRRAVGVGNEEEDLLDVLLRIQKDGGLLVPLDMGTICNALDTYKIRCAAQDPERRRPAGSTRHGNYLQCVGHLQN